MKLQQQFSDKISYSMFKNLDSRYFWRFVVTSYFPPQGQLEYTKELLTFMREDEIAPSAQSYAAVFECIERSPLVDKVSVLNFYTKEMQEHVSYLQMLFTYLSVCVICAQKITLILL